jgi:2-iminobutanoate/2-iminopropanoate deaminase
MSRSTLRGLLIAAVLLLLTSEGKAEPLEYVGKPVRNIPVSNAVKAGKQVFVSGTPAYGSDGKVAVGDFDAQIRQVMDNIGATLKGAGTDWSRFVKTTIYLTRPGDFADMNRVYSTYFTDGKFPARTTVTVAGLPSPDFLLEIECEAVLE